MLFQRMEVKEALERKRNLVLFHPHPFAQPLLLMRADQSFMSDSRGKKEKEPVSS